MNSLPELLGAGQRLDRDASASTSLAVLPAAAAPLIYAGAARAGPIVLGNFMGAPLLFARGSAARRNSFNPY